MRELRDHRVTYIYGNEMEHIRLFDWCSSVPDIYFVNENDLDNCVTERILRNKFYDPLISSDSEGEGQQKVNWKEVFKRKNQQKDHVHRRFVAGLRAPPPYPRVSSLTSRQHYSGLKILSAENHYVLQTEFMGRVKQHDRDDWQEIKEAYEKEQVEYIEWAKSLWTNTHCIRALRPKPTIETVYEAQFKMKAEEMASFPKQYALAAQISFESREECKFEHVKDLVSVKITDLPHIRFPDLMSGKLSILRPCPVPEPCTKHPASFVLPSEKTKSILPVTEIHKELAQYALDNDCQYVASESALRCLVNRGSHWTLPVTVGAAINADGEKINVLVIGSEFSLKREYARTRSYRAYRHLLEYSLIPPLEKAKILERLDQGESDSEDNIQLDGNLNEMTLDGFNNRSSRAGDTMDVGSDDEDEEPLIIAFDEERNDNDSDSDDEKSLQIAEESDSESAIQPPGNTTPSARKTSITLSEESSKDNQKNNIAGITSPIKSISSPKVFSTRMNSAQSSITASKESMTAQKSSTISFKDKNNSNLERNSENGKETKEQRNKIKKSMESSDTFYKCSCKDSLFKMPPPRSFKRWQIKGSESNKTYDVIIHCSHKARGASGEVILEPIPEYQIDLGGSRQSDDDVRALALSLALRRSASIVTARVDAPSGELVTIDNIFPEEFADKHGDKMNEISGTLHAALTQLTGLLPGHYLLVHESCHGSNALLYAARMSNSEQSLTLEFDSSLPADESSSVKVPPTLAPVLLPVHKFRKILPCTFTPFENQVAKEQKKPPVKQKPPPQAIRDGDAGGGKKWPKRKRFPKTKSANRGRN